MQPADRWAFRDIRDVIAEVVANNKRSFEKILITDTGKTYVLDVTLTIPKDGEGPEENPEPRPA